MNQRFDEIIDFADIGEFIDQPVKIYSSGMVLRLAFAVQACIVPDILIVDEALAVGDMYFQTKCMAKISELRKRGTSILFVSHSLGTVKAICTWAALIDHGKIILSGHPDPVGDKYVSTIMQERHRNATPAINFIEEQGQEHRSIMQPPFLTRITERFGTGAARYAECKIFQDGREVASVDHGAMCEVHALLQYNEDVMDWGEVGVVVRTIDGLDLFAANSFLLREMYPPQHKGGLVKIIFKFQAIMAAGIYSIALGYRVPVQGEYVDKVFNAVAFTVEVTDGMPVPFMFSIPSTFEYEVIESVTEANIHVGT